MNFPAKICKLYLWSNNTRNWVQYFLSLVFLSLCALLLTVVGFSRIVLLPCVYLCYLTCVCCTVCVCISVLHNLVAGLLARNRYSEGPATGHLDTGFSRFPCAYKQTLRRFPTFQVATKCFSCSPPDLNLLVTDFMFCIHVK